MECFRDIHIEADDDFEFWKCAKMKPVLDAMTGLHRDTSGFYAANRPASGVVPHFFNGSRPTALTNTFQLFPRIG